MARAISGINKGFSMISMAILVGIWSTTCIQTQISNVNQGYVKEIYSIEENGSYEYVREWYQDSNCTEPKGTEMESGTLEIGSKLQGLFVPENTFEANFSSQSGIDLGAINVFQGKYIKIARGVRNSTMRNTMLSLFEFKKLQ
jgi:hypothetical protein